MNFKINIFIYQTIKKCFTLTFYRWALYHNKRVIYYLEKRKVFSPSKKNLSMISLFKLPVNINGNLKTLIISNFKVIETSTNTQEIESILDGKTKTFNNVKRTY